MKEMMKIIRMGLAAVVGLVWVLVSPFLIMFLIAGLSLLNRENIKESLRASGLYENAAETLVDTLFFRVESELLGDANENREKLQMIGESKRVAIENMKKTFPDFWLRYEAEKNIDYFYDYLEGKNETLVLSVSVQEKQMNASETVAGLFKDLAASLPLCDDGVVGDYYDFDLFSASCLPRNMNLGELGAIIDNGVDKVIPVSQELGEIEVDAGWRLRQLKNVKGSLGYVMGFLIGLLLILPAACWLIWPKINSKNLVVAVNLFLAGIVTAVVGYGFGASYNKDFFRERLRFEVSRADVELVALAYDVLFAWLKSVSSKVFAAGLLMACAGLVLVWVSKKSQSRTYFRRFARIFIYTVLIVAVLVLVWSLYGLGGLSLEFGVQS